MKGWTVGACAPVSDEQSRGGHPDVGCDLGPPVFVVAFDVVAERHNFSARAARKTVDAIAPISAQTRRVEPRGRLMCSGWRKETDI